MKAELFFGTAATQVKFVVDGAISEVRPLIDYVYRFMEAWESSRGAVASYPELGKKEDNNAKKD